MGPFESHHTIPKYIQKKIQKCLEAEGKPHVWELDDVATTLETRSDHWFPDGLHAKISANDIHWNEMGNYDNNLQGAREILEKLEQAYASGPEPRLDLVKVVQEWKNSVGITP